MTERAASPLPMRDHPRSDLGRTAGVASFRTEARPARQRGRAGAGGARWAGSPSSRTPPSPGSRRQPPSRRRPAVWAGAAGLGRQLDAVPVSTCGCRCPASSTAAPAAAGRAARRRRPVTAAGSRGRRYRASPCYSMPPSTALTRLHVEQGTYRADHGERPVELSVFRIVQEPNAACGKYELCAVRIPVSGRRVTANKVIDR